jgi:uncharacterized protein (UPF0218 family)
VATNGTAAEAPGGGVVAAYGTAAETPGGGVVVAYGIPGGGVVATKAIAGPERMVCCIAMAGGEPLALI